jgi:hypothetical protein
MLNSAVCHSCIMCCQLEIMDDSWAEKNHCFCLGRWLSNVKLWAAFGGIVSSTKRWDVANLWRADDGAIWRHYFIEIDNWRNFTSAYSSQQICNYESWIWFVLFRFRHLFMFTCGSLRLVMFMLCRLFVAVSKAGTAALKQAKLKSWSREAKEKLQWKKI